MPNPSSLKSIAEIARGSAERTIGAGEGATLGAAMTRGAMTLGVMTFGAGSRGTNFGAATTFGAIRGSGAACGKAGRGSGRRTLLGCGGGGRRTADRGGGALANIGLGVVVTGGAAVAGLGRKFAGGGRTTM